MCDIFCYFPHCKHNIEYIENVFILLAKCVCVCVCVWVCVCAWLGVGECVCMCVHNTFTFTFTFMHLADAFIQSDLQLHSGYTFFY